MEMGERKGEGREGSRERTGASRNFPSSTTKGDDLDSLGTHLEAKLPFEGIARAKGSAVVLSGSRTRFFSAFVSPFRVFGEIVLRGKFHGSIRFGGGREVRRRRGCGSGATVASSQSSDV